MPYELDRAITPYNNCKRKSLVPNSLLFVLVLYVDQLCKCGLGIRFNQEDAELDSGVL